MLVGDEGCERCEGWSRSKLTVLTNIYINPLPRKYTLPSINSYRSGAVHVGDRILAINDVLIKALSVKDVYQMLDFSGEVVKLRLQSVDQTNQDSTKEKGYKIPEIPEKNLKIPEIPDMTSLHRVSAWAEIFNELDQIVASTTPVGDGAHKRPGNKDGAVKDDGTYVNVSDTKYKIQNSQNAESKDDVTESQITASVCNEVKSGNEDFWETFDALWEGHVSSTKQDEDKESKTDCQKKCEYSGKSKSDVESPAERDKSKTDVVLHGTAITFPRTGSENTDVKNGDHDSTSGTLKGRSISVRYVVREKCVTPDAQISHKDSFERSQSVASGYETDCSTLRSSTNDIVHNGRMSRTETEPFAASIDSFDISNDADDKLSYSPVVKISSQSPISEFLETRTFSVQKSTEHGFGFSLMPDKFKQEVYVASVLPGGPCDGLLQPLDKIIKVCFMV